MSRLKLWQLEEGKRYRDQGGSEWIYDDYEEDWFRKAVTRDLIRQANMMTYSEIKVLDFTECVTAQERMVKFYRPTMRIVNAVTRSPYYLSKEMKTTDNEESDGTVLYWHEDEFLELPVNEDGKVLWEQLES